MSGLYVYAIAGGRMAAFRIAGRTISFENLGGVYAAVERRNAAPELSEEELRAQHEIVAAIAHRMTAVLPARFGSFVPEDELRRVIDLRRGAIRDALELVKGRAQMTLRIVHETAAETTNAAAPPREPGAQRSGTEYLLGRQAAVRSTLPTDIITALNDAVRDLVAAARAEPGQTPTVARLYHLIERGTERAYRRALMPAAHALSPSTIVATGPWPTFAFVPELWP